jgi:2-amino-4-hydroxy-6-hydroxymethyldihydropteridine diphosphokinase
MADLHRAYLNIGANIGPEVNLPRALELLRENVQVLMVSQAWETRAVGADGPNFLNACALLLTPLSAAELKAKVINPIEDRLGRMRSDDRNAPRTIDLDIALYDDSALHLSNWDHAYLLVPLAELLPDLPHPVTGERLSDAAQRVSRATWIVPRPDVIAAMKA